jgi:hypothetical protein
MNRDDNTTGDPNVLTQSGRLVSVVLGRKM